MTSGAETPIGALLDGAHATLSCEGCHQVDDALATKIIEVIALKYTK